jgi:hypothetical protein
MRNIHVIAKYFHLEIKTNETMRDKDKIKGVVERYYSKHSLIQTTIPYLLFFSPHVYSYIYIYTHHMKISLLNILIL